MKITKRTKKKLKLKHQNENLERQMVNMSNLGAVSYARKMSDMYISYAENARTRRDSAYKTIINATFFSNLNITLFTIVALMAAFAEKKFVYFLILIFNIFIFSTLKMIRNSALQDYNRNYDEFWENLKMSQKFDRMLKLGMKLN